MRWTVRTRIAVDLIAAVSLSMIAVGFATLLAAKQLLHNNGAEMTEQLASSLAAQISRMRVADRSLDCAPVPRPPLDFDSCWLACLARARARGDTRRGGFLDTCLEPCYPPPGDECRSLRLRYGIRAGTSWGAAADSAAVQARWAALSCDELVGDGVANKWRA